MKILCRTTISLCGFLAIAFLTAGTAAATDTNPADFNVQYPNYETDPFTVQFTPCYTGNQEGWEWE